MITATQKNIVLPPDRINFKNMDKKEFKETHKHLLEWNFGYLLQWHTHLLRIFTYSILDKYSPLTQVTKKKYKTYSKPRLTKGILASINKNKIYKNFCKAKNPSRRYLLHNEFKTYRKLIGNLTKVSNEKYYKTYFQENKNNLYKTWKGIKEVIFFKKTNNMQPHSL